VIHFLLLMALPDEFTVSVSPELPAFTVAVDESMVAAPAAVPAQPVVDDRPVIRFFTADWCGLCKAWENKGGVHDLEQAGFRVEKINIDQRPEFKSKLSSYPTFWLMRQGAEESQYTWRGAFKPAEIISAANAQLKRKQVKQPASGSIYGIKGTSHESRATLIKHLSEDGIHRGKHSLSALQAMTDEQLNSLHDSDHGGSGGRR
jgi:thiol-disulfide isomerase/thioredoxin